MSTYEIIKTTLTRDPEANDAPSFAEAVTFTLLRVEDGALFTVSVKKNPAPINDEDIISGLRTTLSLCLGAIGAPLLEGTRLMPKDETKAKFN